MQLAVPVYDPDEPSRPLLKRNYVLTDSVLQRLTSLKIVSLWVRYPALSAVESFVSLAGIQAQTKLVNELKDAFEDMQDQSHARLAYSTYTQSITELVESLLDQPKSIMFLGDLMRSEGDLIGHSANVAYLATLMGLKLDGYLIKQRKHVPPHRAKEVVALGVGAMLHDIGITLLPEKIQKKYFQEGDESSLAFREHPALGFELVRGHIPAPAANVVLHHHQRTDGSGYAGRQFSQQDGEHMHVFARITAVADAFDHLRNPIKGKPLSTLRALRQLLEPDTLKTFDAQALKALFEVAPPFPPGTQVQLNTGQNAAVVDHNPSDPCRPIVQILNEKDPSTEPIEESDATQADESQSNHETINLSESTTTYIAWHADEPVTELLFDLPPTILQNTDLSCTW